MKPHPSRSGVTPELQKWLDSLNDEQRAAVIAPPGKALVLAGAGSGKTRTLTCRAAWLVAQGEPPWSILLLTFTNKAAREMLERAATVSPAAGEGVWGGTFHSVGLRFLRRHAPELGWPADFSVWDREDQEQALEAIVTRQGWRQADKRFPKPAVLAEILSLAVNSCLPVAELVARRFGYLTPFLSAIEELATRYEEAKHASGAFDFDDLVAKPFALMLENQEIARQWQRRFRHILVDEYQDTNPLQARWVDLLAQGHGSLMVVGDDAQSIYSWRGADCASMLEFPQRHPGTRIYRIETNYRSAPEVLALANAIIALNTAQFEKQLRAVLPPAGHLPRVVLAADNYQQAAWIGQRITELMEIEGVPARDIAVLYRAHFHSVEIQMELARRAIPFVVTSGLRFFEQAHIKDVAAYMKTAVNPRDEIAFTRLLRTLPGIGPKHAARMAADAARAAGTSGAGSPAGSAPGSPHGSPWDAIRRAVKAPAKAAAGWEHLLHLLEELAPAGIPTPPAQMLQSILLGGYLDYLRSEYDNAALREDDLRTLAEFAGGFESAADFLNQMALLASSEVQAAPGPRRSRAADTDTDVVTLSSIHQAKGLEWRVVFIPWLTEGSFPNFRALENQRAIEEERRLFYVAVTRCKEDLTLLCPGARVGGQAGWTYQAPSRFLRELPDELCESISFPSEEVPAWPSAGGFSSTRAASEDSQTPF